jgi:hypothetical protein
MQAYWRSGGIAPRMWLLITEVSITRGINKNMCGKDWFAGFVGINGGIVIRKREGLSTERV